MKATKHGRRDDAPSRRNSVTVDIWINGKVGGGVGVDRILEDVGQFLHLEKPEAFNEAFREVLAGLDSSR